MSETVYVDCPQCGAEVALRYHRWYQGERPHGGYVIDTDVTDRHCECEWSDDDWTTLYDEGERDLIERANDGPEYDPVEDYHNTHR